MIYLYENVSNISNRYLQYSNQDKSIYINAFGRMGQEQSMWVHSMQ